MKLTVIVPTYRRPGPLTWTLTSLFKQRFPEAPPERLRVFVLNNDTRRDEAEAAVRRATELAPPGRWEVRFVQRDPPQYPLDNMYNGILEFAEDGEIVFLNGDDDLALPGSLAVRAAALAGSDADMLISSAAGGLFFTQSEKDGLPKAVLMDVAMQESQAAPVQRLDMGGLCRVCPIFMSNHVYRMGEPFRQGLAEARAFFNRLPGDGKERLAMLPLFLPLPFIRQGRAAWTATVGVLRGQSAAEMFARRNGHLAWTRPGYYHASVYYLLTQTELAGEPALAPLRAEYLQNVFRWSRASAGMADFSEVMAKMNLRASAENWRERVRGFGDQLKIALGLQSGRLRWRFWRGQTHTWQSILAQY